MDSSIYALSSACGAQLRQRQWQVTTAESCTGGWVAQSITSVTGSADWFQCGFVTYSNPVKQKLLQVPDTAFEGPGAPGAVSEETVLAMARGALANTEAHCAISTSGIAGPNGGTAEKPVGTVWVGWAWREQVGDEPQARARLYHFNGDREAVRRQTVEQALAGLLEILNEQYTG